MPSETLAPDLTGPRRAQRRHAARTLRLGCVQLTDAAPLLVAEELGLFDAVGLRVSLSVESAWAALRDKLAFGALDAAQLLGPMPIALSAGLDGVKAQVTVSAGLGANGNTLTISRALAAEIGRFPRPLPAAAFAAVARRRADAGRPVTLGVVFPYSSHNYLTRWWLASAGLDPDRDLRLVVVPPALCAQRLADGAIDGFCAGEPWGSHAAERGAGTIALSSGDIWPNHPEKVLAFAAGYALRDPESATACTAATIAATRWLDEPENKAEAVHILQRRIFPDLSAGAIGAAFDGTAEGFMQAAPLRFRTATLPRREQAGWWLRQMRRWGHIPPGIAEATALTPWRQDIWRAAAARLREVEPPAPNPPPADLPLAPMPETRR
ncbi:CmpA/NrtA family ABC transporter substrate-binding protein [Dankookia rubra]|uniref:CmpA/NrtA family ABC transporter substrate-binding protein n=1 Tax=Dankookia rubra TaxID=1442381 RepID=UPI001408AB7A|nr:CmpA/NrtA family ABC transporter substrate-binding protein [Dankookia rubra]